MPGLIFFFFIRPSGDEHGCWLWFIADKELNLCGFLSRPAGKSVFVALNSCCNSHSALFLSENDDKCLLRGYKNPTGNFHESIFTGNTCPPLVACIICAVLGEWPHTFLCYFEVAVACYSNASPIGYWLTELFCDIAYSLNGKICLRKGIQTCCHTASTLSPVYSPVWNKCEHAWSAKNRSPVFICGAFK